MKKRLALTFLLGAATGVGIYAFSHNFYHPESRNSEVKVLTKTEYKTIRETIVAPGDSLDNQKYPEVDSLTEADYDENDPSLREVPSEDPESQMEKFERSVASEAPEEAAPGSPAPEDSSPEAAEPEEPAEVIEVN